MPAAHILTTAVYDRPQTLNLQELQHFAEVDPSRRCINCGGYAGNVLDEPAPCTCEGDYRPVWKAAQDEIARRAIVGDYSAWSKESE